MFTRRFYAIHVTHEVAELNAQVNGSWREDCLLGETLEFVGRDGVLVGVRGGQVDGGGDVADELLDGQDGGRAAGRHHAVGEELALVLGEFGGVGGLGGEAVGDERGRHRVGDVGQI